MCQVVSKQYDCIIASFEGMFFSGLVLKNKPAAPTARCTDGDVTLKAGRQAGRQAPCWRQWTVLVDAPLGKGQP